MHEQRFDQLSRQFAAFRTRRQALKAVAGAVVAMVAGTRVAEAQTCSSHYSACTDDAACCAGAVCEYGLCMPGCRIEGTFYSPWSMPPGEVCHQCTPELSTTSWSAANEGMSCWSGDPSAGPTTCRNGACTGTGPVDCRPQTACHTAAINPQTGQCEQGFAEAGTLCGNAAMCYGEFYQPADACDGNGFCIGGGSQTWSCAPYVCGVGACTTSCVSDADCAAGAHCDDGQCLPDADLGQPCDEDGDCQSGICSGGVCCNQRCEGLCETCSAETGGFCSPVVCDDGLSCTSGVCDETTGECRYTVIDGSCLIDGACHASGEYNPTDACYRCTPDQRADDWTPVGCFLDLPCVSNVCKRDGDCEYKLKPDSCLIDGVCYADGDQKPGSDCEVCDRERDPDDWSIGGCDHSAFCASGACVTSVSGAFTVDDPLGVCSSSNDRYELHTVMHTGGPLNLLASSVGRESLPLARLFTTFDPANPCANDLTALYGYTRGCRDGQLMGITYLDPGVYTVVVSGSVSTLGNYTLEIFQDPLSTC